MRAFAFALAIAFALGGLACGSRKHMSPDYGQSVKRAMALQAQKGREPIGGDPAGLDPDEAVIVNENYRKSLAKGGAAAKQPARSGIIIVEDPNARPQPK